MLLQLKYSPFVIKTEQRKIPYKTISVLYDNFLALSLLLNEFNADIYYTDTLNEISRTQDILKNEALTAQSYETQTYCISHVLTVNILTPIYLKQIK